MAFIVKKASLEVMFKDQGKLVLVLEGDVGHLYEVMSDFLNPQEPQEDLGPTLTDNQLKEFASKDTLRSALSYLKSEFGCKTPDELTDNYNNAGLQCVRKNIEVQSLKYDLPDDMVTNEKLQFISSLLFKKEETK
jgi:hypothetical protein